MEQALPLRKFSLLPGWICLGVASLSLILLGPFIGSIIGTPLFLAAFVLAIIGMAKNNVIGGIVLLILTFILPPIALFGSLAFAFALGAPKASATPTKITPAIESTEQ